MAATADHTAEQQTATSSSQTSGHVSGPNTGSNTGANIGTNIAPQQYPSYSGPALFHVGYIKTATTYLQEKVFNRTDLGLALPAGNQSRAHLVAEFLVDDDYLYSGPQTALRLKVLEAGVRANGCVPIWSEETFLGNLAARSYHGRRVADKLADACPEAKILISVREQRSFALSAYAEYINQGGTQAIDAFIGTGREALSFTPHLRHNWLFYDQAIRHYQQRFGPANVLVLPYELMRRDRAAYFQALGDFIGRPLDPAHLEATPSHARLSAAGLVLKRWLNRILPPTPNVPRQRFIRRAGLRAVGLLAKLIPRRFSARIRTRWQAAIEARYSPLFAASNQETSKLTGLRLSDYGYL